MLIFVIIFVATGYQELHVSEIKRLSYANELVVVHVFNKTTGILVFCFEFIFPKTRIVLLEITGSSFMFFIIFSDRSVLDRSMLMPSFNLLAHIICLLG